MWYSNDQEYQLACDEVMKFFDDLITNSEKDSEPGAVADTAPNRDSSGFQVVDSKMEPAALSVSVSLIDRTNALIRGLELVLTHHSVFRTIRVALGSQVHGYLDNAPTEGIWLKRCKSLLAYPFARYLRNGLPEAPDCGYFVPRGILRRFMKSRLNAYNRKNTHLWFSWMQCKRSCLPSSEGMISESYDKHLATLTKVDDGDDDTIARIMENETFRVHLAKVRREVGVAFAKDKKEFTERHASLSASYESSRGTDGAHGALHRVAIGKEAEDPSYYLGVRTELHSMIYRPKSFVNGRIRINCTSEVRTTDTYDNHDDWKQSIFLSRTQLKKRVLEAKIQGIVEPLKVRVISKGPALEYYCMQPLQKAIHGVLRQMPCYRLIGRPLSPTDIPDLYVQPMKHGLKGDEEWISVDYSAATDGLSWKYSGAIFKEIIKDLPQEVQELALDVLGPHKLFYPTKDGKRYEYKGTMSRGQLMGSILSFPVLCLANMGLYLHVTNNYQIGWKHKERLDSVLINGDDQLYLAPPSVFDFHIREGMKVGLEMTVGKAYHHKSYTNVNSTSVVCPIGGTPWKIPFLNTGLFFGQNKVMSKVSIEQETYRCEEEGRSGIVTVLNEVLAGALPGRQSSLLKLWLSTHSGDEIRKDCVVHIEKYGHHTRNLFLPISMGGMGVEPPLGWKFHVTPMDKRYASYLNRDRYKLLQMVGPQLVPEFKEIDTQKPLSSYNQSKVIDSLRSLKICWRRLKGRTYYKRETMMSCHYINVAALA